MLIMVWFELKKIFGSFGGKIALIIYIVFLVLSCWAAATGVTGRGVYTIDDQGQELTGPAAVKMIRTTRNEWEGVLDEEKITEVIQELRRIYNSPEYNSDIIAERDAAFGWQEGIRPIRDMMIDAYNDSIDVYEYNDYYIPESLSPSDASDFYSNRMKLLTQYLETGNGKDKFTDNEKEWLIQHYADWETPIYYDYTLGWQQLLENFQFFSAYGALIIGFLVTGIFTKEFRLKADAVYFTTVYGRNKATAAKIKAGFLTVTGLYWGAVLIFTLFTLCYFGFDGAGCAIQLIDNYWECPYNWTCGGTYLMAVICGYIGNLFVAFLTMYVSAKTKSSTFSVTVSFLAIFISWILEMTGIEALEEITLLPDRVLAAFEYLNQFAVCDLGFTAVGALPFAVVIYGILTIVLVPMMYQEFRRKRIC